MSLSQPTLRTELGKICMSIHMYTYLYCCLYFFLVLNFFLSLSLSLSTYLSIYLSIIYHLSMGLHPYLQSYSSSTRLILISSLFVVVTLFPHSEEHGFHYLQYIHLFVDQSNVINLQLQLGRNPTACLLSLPPLPQMPT